ncbi:MAG: serine hydrolase [Planctomycetota bacterium]|nr:serine hydrolase [Planctomycetota bacterium]
MTRNFTKRTGLLPFIVLFVLTPAAMAQTRPTEGAAASAEQIVEAYLQKSGDRGFSAAVWAEGGVAWSQQWGQRDKENGHDVTPDTMFRIGSVSKMITVMTLGSMVQRGELSLDATIDTYLPEAPANYAPLTPRLLAGHLAGVRHYASQAEFLSQKQCDEQAAALEIFAADPLVSKPGSEYHYSTYGYTTLGAVMERAAGKSLAELLRERIYAPSGMENTFAEHNETVEGELAVPYVSVQGQNMISPPVNNSCKLSGGGLVSTPIDLAKFLGAVCENRIVSRETLQEMLTSMHTADGEATGVGLGWRIANDDRERRYIHHGGSAAGGRCFILLYPDAGVGVALCMNLYTDGPTFGEDMALQIATLFLDSEDDQSP